eukprot:Skav233083  [mRNA]  locus=scaffold4078:152921:154192:+ [translate_table: standard]
MEVCFLASGETLAVLDADEFEGKSAKTLKQTLASQIRVSRFRQRLFLEGDAREISDDEIFVSVPSKVQLVVLDFLPPDAAEDESMIKACDANDQQALNELLQCPRDPNVESAVPPLSIAASRGHVNIAELLLEAGAAPDQVNGNGVTPLFIAAGRGFVKIARLLLEAGAIPDQARAHGAPAFFGAAHRENAEIVDMFRRLIEAGATVAQATAILNGDGRDGDLAGLPRLDGSTPLLAAVEAGNVDIAQLLLEAGASPDQARRDGSTPLLVAAQTGNVDIARLLLEAGASPDKARKDGSTPLLVAAGAGAAGASHLDVARLLIEAGAGLDWVKNDCAQLLICAAKLHNGKLIRLLLEGRAAPDQEGTGGTTPLFCAAELGHVKIFRLLLEAQADPDKAREDGATPLRVAAQNGHLDITRLVSRC